MKTILVTGGCGYIGSHVCAELLNALIYKVVIVDNNTNSNHEVVEKIEKATGRKITNFFHVDLRDADSVSEIFETEKIDAVIHLAGLKAVGESVQKPLLYYDNNVLASINLFMAMKVYGVTKLVFSSSATVYGTGAGSKIPFIEDSSLAPTNPYGRTKLMIEQIIKDCFDAGTFSAINLRYFNPVGCHPSGLLYEDPSGIPANLMPYLIQISEGKREKLSIYGNDYPTRDGTAIRDYIDIMDLASGHVAAIDKLFDTKENMCEAVNLGTGIGVTVLELVKDFERENNVKIPYEIVARRPGDVAVMIANCDKAWKLLRWRAKMTSGRKCQTPQTCQKNYTKSRKRGDTK